MILFYSDNCGHCKMLLETIKRYNTNNIIKYVSIDMLKATGKNLNQIHSVPALMIMPEKKLIFGKNVFDYLLLPKSGKLLQTQNKESNVIQNETINNQLSNEEPASFSMNSNKFSDNFAMIEDDTNISNNGLYDQSYRWSSLNAEDDDKVNKQTIKDIGIETRTRKEPIDINDLYARRALELEQNDLNINQLPHPNNTR
mgnify:CR=1 FL=1